MTKFPSVEWFESVRQLVNNDETFRKLGTCDARVGIKVGDKLFQLDFEAFECTGVRRLTKEAELDECDFYLEQTPEAWTEMIRSIKTNGRANLQHTLNTIDLNLPEGFARSKDGYKRDLFYRFNQTFQDFFNASAKIDTTF